MTDSFHIKSWSKSFLERNRDVFIVSLLTILISFFGTILFLHFTAENVQVAETEMTYIENEEMDEEELTWKTVFVHNFMILLPALIGVFTFGFITFWYMVLQGYLLGTSIYYLAQDLSLWLVFKYTFLHGIFEFIAIALVGTFALKPGIITIKCIVQKKRFIEKRDVKDMFILLMLYCMFLFLAAVIEGLVSYNI